jgi:hypothetical protein
LPPGRHAGREGALSDADSRARWRPMQATMATPA